MIVCLLALYLEVSLFHIPKDLKIILSFNKYDDNLIIFLFFITFFAWIHQELFVFL